MRYYSGNDRYQFQPWYIRLYRRLRWQPYMFFRFWWFMLIWLLKGLPPAKWLNTDGTVDRIETRWETFKVSWSCTASYWQIYAGWHYTTEEVIGNLRGYTDVWTTECSTPSTETSGTTTPTTGSSSPPT